VSLSDGLTAQFTTGAAPSFATGDLYRFRALQPYALSNAFNPDPESWRWDDINAWLQADMGVVKTIDALAIAFHSLPAGCIMSLQGGMDGIVWDWNETIPWSAATITHLFVAKTARYLRFNVALADDAAIGWIWAGEAISTEFSAECLLAHDYQIERGAGLNPSAAYLGATRSGEISWELLRDPDMQKLMPMLDYLKQNDDQPMILIPQSTRPEEAYPMRVNIDRIDAEEDGGYQSDQGRERRYTMRWELAGVVA
jgi:hypothetical protein